MRALEGALIDADGGHRAQQDGDVAIGGGARRLGAAISLVDADAAGRGVLGGDFEDAFRDSLGLELAGFVEAVGALGGDELDASAERGARGQEALVGYPPAGLRGAGGHRAGEEGVDERHEVRERAVVVGETHMAASAARGVFAPDLVEDLDLGAAEGVDGLLGVADDEEVGAFVGETGDHLLLDVVGVLELVDEDEAAARGDGRGGEVVVAQEVARGDEEVVEIEDAAGALGSFVCLGGAVEGFEEEDRLSGAGGPILGIHGVKEVGGFLCFVADGLQGGPDFGQTEVCATERGCPLLAREALQAADGVAHRGGVAPDIAPGMDPGVVRGDEGGALELSGIAAGALDLAEHRDGSLELLGGKLPGGEGAGDGPGAQAKDVRNDASGLAAIEEGGADNADEFAVLRSGREHVAQRGQLEGLEKLHYRLEVRLHGGHDGGVDGFGQEDLRVVGLNDAKAGPDAGLHGKLAEDAAAETVDGADIGGLEREELRAPEGPIVGRGGLAGKAADARADAGLELVGGLFGEGDGGDARDVRAAAGEYRDVALDERGGLAAAGAGAEDDICVEAVGGVALARIEADVTHRRPPGTRRARRYACRRRGRRSRRGSRAAGSAGRPPPAGHQRP